jgi:4-hydroxybenzoate polyprenyltransferase
MSSLVAATVSSGVAFARTGFSLRGILAGLAMFALTAFGFQVNDVLDYRKDRAAGVQRPIATGILSRKAAMLFAGALLLLTFAASAWVGRGAKVLAVTSLALIFYTPAAQRLPLVKGLYVALLCVAPLYYGSVVSNAHFPLPPYALLVAFIVGREAFMDSNETRGDRGAGMVTIGAVLGETRAKRASICLMALSMAIFVALASGVIAKTAATLALVSLLCVFIWPRLDDTKRIELSRIPMLAAAVAIACG